MTSPRPTLEYFCLAQAKGLRRVARHREARAEEADEEQGKPLPSGVPLAQHQHGQQSAKG